MSSFTPPWRRRSALAFAVAAAGACVVGEIDYTGKTCPCPGGWLCANGACARTESPLDAGTDAASEDAAAAAFCASLAPPPLYCNDFDEDGGLRDLVAQTTDGGVVGVGGADSFSPPSSLFARVAAVPAGRSAYAVAFGNQTIAPAPSEVTLSFAANLHISGGGPIGHVATLVFASGWGIGVVAQPGSLFVDELLPTSVDAAASPGEHPHVAKDWTRGWTRLSLSVRRAGSGWTSSLSLDDVLVEDAHPLSAAFHAGAVATFVLGWGFVTGPSDDLAVSFDDVVVEAE